MCGERRHGAEGYHWGARPTTSLARFVTHSVASDRSLAADRQPLAGHPVHPSGGRVDPRRRRAASWCARRRGVRRGTRRSPSGDAPPLFKPIIEIDGAVQELARGTMAWERALAWLPTFTCTLGDVVVRGTIFAPYGRDADLAGAVYAIACRESRRGARGARPTRGHAGTSAAPRTHRASRRTIRRSCRAAATTWSCSRAVRSQVSSPSRWRPMATPRSTTSGRQYSLARTLSLPAGGHAQTAFYLAAGPERDGAEATVAVLRRRGWRALLTGTREALQQLEQSTGAEGIDRLINRNLLFAYFFARRTRARRRALLPRAHARAVAFGAASRFATGKRSCGRSPPCSSPIPGSRASCCCGCASCMATRRAAASTTSTARCSSPASRSRESPRIPIAVDRYARDTGDGAIVDEPAIADTLYLAQRRPARPTRPARAALLHRGHPPGDDRGASVHAARQRHCRAGARDPAAHARRGDVARSGGSR